MPRRGSLQFRPRKRAKTQKATFRSYAARLREGVGLGGFPGYKAGMTHVQMVEDRPGRLTTGQEVVTAATVIETPPVRAVGLVGYVRTPYGEKTLTAGLRLDSPGDLSRKVRLPDGGIDTLGAAVEKMRAAGERLSSVRLLVHTIPRLAGLPKKTPEILEIPLMGGSSPAEVLEAAEGMVGRFIRASEVFSPGELIDVTAVTKGHGWQGVVRRFGVSLLRHKAGKARWRVGSLGSRHPPYTTWRVPRAGQTGYHKRTEYNKRVLFIGQAKYDEEMNLREPSPEINPPGGFRRYGLVRGDYLVVSGSIPGPVKRFVMMRHAARPHISSLGEPQIIRICGVRTK